MVQFGPNSNGQALTNPVTLTFEKRMEACSIRVHPITASPSDDSRVEVRKDGKSIRVVGSSVGEVTTQVEQLDLVDSPKGKCRYFALTTGLSSGICSVVGGVKPDEYVRLQQEAQPPQTYYFSAGSPEKLRMRELVAATGEIEQPDFVRLTSHRPQRTHAIEFSCVNLGAIPFRELLSPSASFDQITLLPEDPQGFTIRRIDGRGFFYSKDPKLTEIAAKCGDVSHGWDEACWQKFVQLALISDVSFVRFSASNPGFYGPPVVDSIRRLPPGLWFIKDALGTRSTGVFRVSVDHGQISNVELPPSLRGRMRSNFSDLPPAEQVLELVQGDAFSAPIVQVPFAEKAMPALAGDKFAFEPRVIFDIRLKAFECVGVYVKSTEGIVADSAQGGISITYQEFAQRAGVLDPTSWKASLISHTRGLLMSYVERAQKEGYRFRPVVAVDVRITGRTEEQLTYKLLEIQDGPDIENKSWLLDEEEARKLRQLNAELADDHDWSGPDWQ